MSTVAAKQERAEMEAAVDAYHKAYSKSLHWGDERRRASVELHEVSTQRGRASDEYRTALQQYRKAFEKEGRWLRRYNSATDHLRVLVGNPAGRGPAAPRYVTAPS